MPDLAESFGRTAEAYELGRPEYAEAAIDAVGLAPDSVVLDLAAGTGKLTRQLVPRFARVVAVEPLERGLLALQERRPARRKRRAALRRARKAARKAPEPAPLALLARPVPKASPAARRTAMARPATRAPKVQPSTTAR